MLVGTPFLHILMYERGTKMQLKHAFNRLVEIEGKGAVHVFRTQDLRVLFHEDSDRAFVDTVARMTKAGFLRRASRGVFFNPLSGRIDAFLIERVAAAMRSGEICYLSLESVLCAHSIISQQMPDRITIMTTGRSGHHVVDGMGTIEFTHTKRNVRDFLPDLLWDTGFLPHAPVSMAYRDLKHVGRNLHLVDEEMLKEVMDEQNQAKFH